MSRRALVIFAAMSVIWGIPYLFIRVAVGEVEPSVLVFARTGIAALILLPFAILRTDLRPVLARWPWVVAFAAVEIAIPWILLGSAEQQLASSVAGLLVAGVPLVGTVVALVTRSRDGVGLQGFLGLLVGLAGVAAIVGVTDSPGNATALVEMAFVVIGYAIGPAILARRLAGLPAAGVMSLSLALCALVYAPIAAVQRPAAMPSAGAVGSIVVLAVVCTAAAFLLFSALIDEIGPVRATVITYVNPAVAGLLGALVLDEPFTPVMALGLVLVIVGSALATRRPTVRAAAVESGAAAPAVSASRNLDEPAA